jgi:hypothetical protein
MLLAQDGIAVHPYIIAELALGNLRQRDRTIAFLSGMHTAPKASDEELLEFIVETKLAGNGVGFVDAHLLASCRRDPLLRLWTRDKRLSAMATALGLGFRES